MLKKIAALLVAAALAATTLVSCGSTGGSSSVTEDQSSSGTVSGDASDGSENTGVDEDFKVGFIFVGDNNEGYTYAHYLGAMEMKEALNLSDDQVIIKTNIPEDERCFDAACDLADQGCDIIFANSFSHESYMIQAAEKYPDVEFCHATGYQASSCGLNNMHNYFTAVYESRYVSGVVAGLKLQELLDNGDITEAKIGYVGAYPYAEVISGFTSFFLGVRSVCESATMEVTYTNSWADASLEAAAAEALIADGCVLISQHADTTGASITCQSEGVYIVGYNISMIETAPDYALTSASISWGPYYTYATECAMNGEDIIVDWCKGYSEGADRITELNPNAIAEGTEEKVAEVEEGIKNGTLHVFDTATWTVEGKTLDSYVDDYGNEYIWDGYFHESELASAPAFSLIIDGITIK